MADTIPITCPECGKKMNVPAAVAGKKIKCKGCESVIAVPGAKAAAPAAKPAAKPAPKPAAKPASPPPSPPPPASRHGDDDDDDANPYARQEDDLDVARCPFCAKELDPPDTKICLNCGYDLVQRRRHESKKVYALTTADYLNYHLATFAATFGVIVFITLIVLSILYMGDLFKEMGLQSDKENPITKKLDYDFPPGAITLPFVVFSLFMIWKMGSFAFVRYVYKWKPVEKKKADK